MATYAAYRHVELDNVGYGKKRVLKPPGGGSSDIFGSSPEKTSPRRVKTHNQSQLGSALFGDTTDNGGKDNGSSPTSNNKPGNDSYKRLFGPPDAPSTTCTKNHMRSNIPLSAETPPTSGSDSTSPARSASKSMASSILNGLDDGVRANDSTDGNPVTGTGYAAEPSRNTGPAIQNGRSSSSNSSSIGEKSTTDSSPASTTTTGQQNKAPQPRTRVPPGGYSSGLW